MLGQKFNKVMISDENQESKKNKKSNFKQKINSIVYNLCFNFKHLASCNLLDQSMETNYV